MSDHLDSFLDQLLKWFDFPITDGDDGYYSLADMGIEDGATLQPEQQDSDSPGSGGL